MLDAGTPDALTRRSLTPQWTLDPAALVLGLRVRGRDIFRGAPILAILS
jgi:hypothetical protein